MKTRAVKQFVPKRLVMEQDEEGVLHLIIEATAVLHVGGIDLPNPPVKIESDIKFTFDIATERLDSSA